MTIAFWIAASLAACFIAWWLIKSSFGRTRDAPRLADDKVTPSRLPVETAREPDSRDQQRALIAAQQASRARRRAESLASAAEAEAKLQQQQQEERLVAARQRAEAQAAAIERSPVMPTPVEPVKVPAPISAGPSDSADLRRMPTVLVADDSKVVRVKTGNLLTRNQFRVLYAVDGEDALRQIHEAVPDVLITDVDMPGLTGFELTQALRHGALTARLPIIMITAADDKIQEAANVAGVDLVLGKPYGEDELLDCIRRVLSPQLVH